MNKRYLLEAEQERIGLFIFIKSAGILQVLHNGKTLWNRFLNFTTLNEAEFIYMLSLDDCTENSTVCYYLPTLLIRTAMWATIKFADRLLLVMSDFKMQDCHFANCLTWERLFWNHHKRSISAINWLECWQWHNSVSGLY